MKQPEYIEGPILPEGLEVEVHPQSVSHLMSHYEPLASRCQGNRRPTGSSSHPLVHDIVDNHCQQRSYDEDDVHVRYDSFRIFAQFMAWIERVLGKIFLLSDPFTMLDLFTSVRSLEANRCGHYWAARIVTQSNSFGILPVVATIFVVSCLSTEDSPQMDNVTFGIVTILLLLIGAELLDIRRKVEAIDRKLDKVLDSK